MRRNPLACWLCILALLALPLSAFEGEAIGTRLHIEAADGEYLAFVDNHLPGPVEVMLHARRAGIASDPPLPARATVPANGSVLVARMQPPGNRAGAMQLSVAMVPGRPGARARDVEYLVPLQQSQVRIDQGFDGAFSHSDDENRHALDFAAPVGTPVLAARAGVVMQVESAFRTAGVGKQAFGGRANYVRIAHDDGTMGLYAHLAYNGVLARVGQQVAAGERIAVSGNTGLSTAPHLHFAVQVNGGMRLVSIPFRMRGVAPSAR